MTPLRTLVVFCPDWSLVAAGLADRPAAVVAANAVLSCSAFARSEGVRAGQRRREAQACCPELEVVPHDPARDARSFEAVVSAVAAFTPRVEVTGPGVCALPARAPARYFGGEASLVAKIRAAASAAVVAVAAASGTAAPERPCEVGIADGPFAARLAAHSGTIVAPGKTPSFLAPFGVGVLGMADLAGIFRRLGIGTLGELGAVDEGKVGERFGREGLVAHRLARGLDTHGLVLSEPPPDLVVSVELDPPVDRSDALSFVAVGLADELVSRLGSRGLVATQLLVEAETEHGEGLQRWWRGDRPFTTRAMVDRVRWQLEGWLEGPVITAPTAGITLLRLTVGEAVPDDGRQLDLLGRTAETSFTVERGLARVQGLLGHEAVVTPVPAGGRGPGEQYRLVPWGTEAVRPPRGTRGGRAGADGGDVAGGASAHEPPWPGRVPSPSPALVHARLTPAVLTGSDGEAVGVTGRGRCTSMPRQLSTGGRPALEILGWSGPWPADERWWDPGSARRRARLQVLLEDGTAHLLVLERGSWAVEGTYD